MKVLLALFMMLVACGNDDDAGSSPDASLGPPGVDAIAEGSCLQWRREPVPITEVGSMEALSINPERSARMLVTVLQCPGDLPAKPEYFIAQEFPTIILNMTVWRHRTNCAAPEPVQRPVTIKFPYAGTWGFALYDDSYRTVTVDAAPGGACNPSGGSCQRDCDCAEGVCLTGYGIITEFSQCARPCELDRDCGGNGKCVDQGDGLHRVCSTSPECAVSTDCPAGFDCQSGTCEPTFQLSSSTRHDCACDSDCDPGLRCALHEGQATGKCEALCLTESSGFCQGPHVCGIGTVEDPFRGVCGYIGE